MNYRLGSLNSVIQSLAAMWEEAFTSTMPKFIGEEEGMTCYRKADCPSTFVSEERIKQAIKP